MVFAAEFVSDGSNGLAASVSSVECKAKSLGSGFLCDTLDNTALYRVLDKCLALNLFYTLLWGPLRRCVSPHKKYDLCQFWLIAMTSSILYTDLLHIQHFGATGATKPFFLEPEVVNEAIFPEARELL